MTARRTGPTVGAEHAAPLTLKSGTSWADAWRRCLTVAPEAFRDDRVLNLWDTRWQADGRVLPATSPVDGTPVAGPPRLDGATAHRAVRAALDQHRAWRHVPLPERRARVAATLDASPSTANCSPCSSCTRSASPGGRPGPTSTGRWTACAGTWTASTG